MPNDICAKFGKRLRELRIKQGWSQEELAYRVGMDTSYLSEIEGGKKEPCLRKIKELSQGFRITLSQFMRGLSRRSSCDAMNPIRFQLQV